VTIPFPVCLLLGILIVCLSTPLSYFLFVIFASLYCAHVITMQLVEFFCDRTLHFILFGLYSFVVLVLSHFFGLLYDTVFILNVLSTLSYYFFYYGFSGFKRRYPLTSSVILLALLLVMLITAGYLV
jgi:hypothetical protein